MGLLGIIPYSKMSQWDVKRIGKGGLLSRYKMVRLGDYIEEQSTRYNISDPKKDYPILGVNNTIGIFDAYIENGANIRQHYKKVENGWIAYNPYRINVGSVGLKDDSTQNQYISPAYVVFSCCDGLDPQYLLLVMRTKAFNREVCMNTTGAVRQTLTFNTLCDMQIPLPDINIQKMFVKDYYDAIQKASAFDEQAVSIGQAMKKRVFEELGIAFDCYELHGRLGLIRFCDISRWDLPFLTTGTRVRSVFETVSMESCFARFMEGEDGETLRVDTSRYPEKKFYYIGMENVEKGNGKLLDMPVVSGSEIKSQTLRVPYGFFIYGKLRPNLNKYWYNSDLGKGEIVCSAEFMVFQIKDDVNVQYFNFVLSSDIVQRQLVDMVSGARMPRVSESVFKNIRIPMPPIGIQNLIADRINESEQQKVYLAEKASKLRHEAQELFESKIIKSKI